MAAQKFDAWLNEPVDPALQPERGYLICTTPRSGSTYLCDLLRTTGKLGKPHEFFSAWMMQRLGRPHRYFPVAEHFDLARTRGCSANGIFGAKVFRYNMGVLSPGAIMAAMGNPAILFLERMDLVGQAISFTRSAITRAFRVEDTDLKEPEYDPVLIRGYLERLIRDNAAWRLWFARQGITPLHLTYEDLVEDPQRVLDGVARKLRVAGPVTIDPAALRVRVQRDELNAEWRERFLASQQGVPAIVDLRSEARVTFDRRLAKLRRRLGQRFDPD
jgi:trehalose 2-sulfotransferase